MNFKAFFLLIVLSAVTNITSIFAAPSGYEIKVKIDGVLPNEMLKMGYHYGDKQFLKDSTLVLNNGWAIFDGEEPLDGGMYFIILPEKAGYFEFLVQEQFFSLETDKTDLVGKMKVVNSIENKLFYENIKWNEEQTVKANELHTAKKNETNEKEKTKIKKQLAEIDKAVKNRISNYQKEYLGTLFYTIVTAGSEPTFPENINPETDKKEALKYLKEHYFDTFDFTDARLAKTNILTKKIKHYTTKLTIQNADSLIKACDKIITHAKADTNHYKIAVTNLLNTYAKPKIMGLDAVYVYLAENYYNEKDAWWVKPADLYRIQERAKDIKPTLIGQKAKDFMLKDFKGEYHKLYNVETDYTVVYFWDPDCGHCKKTTPKLVEFAKNNDLDVTIFTITTEHEEEKWAKYLEKNPEMEVHFHNLADFKFKSRFRQDYDITGTPRVFVLDKQKNIIAKKIQPEQIVPIINRLTK